MGAKLKLRRQQVAIRLHASARGLEVGNHELLEVLRGDNGEGSEQYNLMKGSLTEKEHRLIDQRRKKIRECIDDIRKISNHIYKTTRG